ncbi:Hypothetical predicted protein [Olea europaea subsp. europaea]|uniref:Chromo domain-containing protein n=1 Tax=Olea europaea subsp. europaea TaxID=158383 RepID=A0A8S0VL95_OLEEU|nr:Hypothetical predicted protein [Olea europaea subsp. europaea]
MLSKKKSNKSQNYRLCYKKLQQEKQSDPGNLKKVTENGPQPQVILNTRFIRKKKEVLVLWKDKDIADATWEDSEEIAARFPEIPLEDKGHFNRGGS